MASLLLRAGIWIRAVLSLGRLAVLRSPPPRPGLSVGRVASSPGAEQDLRSMARSPTVYAAVTRRAYTLAQFPVLGIGPDGETLDPARVPWVAALRQLLATPDPSDLGQLFPAMPGETMLAQIVADLLLTGNAFIAVTVQEGTIAGLTRLHPAMVGLEGRPAGDVWVYSSRGRRWEYPRHTVAHLRMLSWEATGAGELGTGAAEPLGSLVEAESRALEQTASVVAQGGADVMVTAESPAGRQFLSVPANREAVAREVTTALTGGPSSRRAFVVGGDLKITDAGLKPADIQAPELMDVAQRAELMALGVLPVAVGLDTANYATAVQQYRIQAENDEILVAILEAALLRPLAQHLARQAGGRWAARADMVSARLDLSGHLGYAYARTEQIARMEALVRLGWTAEQAAQIEGLSVPRPEGTPSTATPSQAPASQAEQAPREPSRLVSALFTRADTPSPALSWEQIDARRRPHDEALTVAAQEQLQQDAEGYAARALTELGSASRGARADGAPVLYGAVDMDAILGELDQDVAGWMEALREDWTASWMAGARDALTIGPAVDPEQVRYDLMEDSAAAVADYSRSRVREIVLSGIERGDSASAIATALREDQAFAQPRALRIARTETVRSQSSGALARYEAAEADGLVLTRTWLANPLARPSHAALNGEEADEDGIWTFSSGVSTTAPGLSGEPGEDINCRCAIVATATRPDRSWRPPSGNRGSVTP